MEVNEKATKYQAEFDNQIYYFCSRGCLLDFEQRPTDFVGEQKPKGERGRLAMASTQTPLVYEVMTPEVVTVPESLLLDAAVKRMCTASGGTLIVLNIVTGQPIGIVTETDIVRRVTAKELSPAQLKVSYAMSSPLITIDPNADIVQAAREMTRRGVKRLVVLDKGKLAGLLTMSDIVRVTPAVVDLLSEYAQLR